MEFVRDFGNGDWRLCLAETEIGGEVKWVSMWLALR